MTTWLCNNCNTVAHFNEYKVEDAAYDLTAYGREAHTANLFNSGDTLYVLSQDRRKRIVVEEYIYTHKVESGERGFDAFVMCGTFIRAETLPRHSAQDHPVYRYFFNTNGHLCQWSAVRFDPK